ncbi:MAG TPA: hypothetical protein G4O12_06915 [Dehalococcoidia bacterium]|nr:hypothetical protein [Dehalococcoidia bacterium]
MIRKYVLTGNLGRLWHCKKTGGIAVDSQVYSGICNKLRGWERLDMALRHIRSVRFEDSLKFPGFLYAHGKTEAVGNAEEGLIRNSYR